VFDVAGSAGNSAVLMIGDGSLFFLVSKTIGALLTPSNFLIAIGIAGLILILSRYRRLGQKLLVVCVAGFAICGFLPIGNLVMLPIETRFPAWTGDGGAPDGIVILGGDVDRILAGIKLARQYPKARIVFSGGNGSLIRTDETTEADYAEELLAGLGLEHERLLFDRQARNTVENAEYSKALAQPKPGERWLLVTSAFHMPRSVGIFRKVGFAVEPYPVENRKKRDWPQVLALDSSFLARVNQADSAVHEWAGLIAYRLRGMTAELLPSPASRP
jgi:uncharacterized SAM-binding protein YcdF (DUF218 family)